MTVVYYCEGDFFDKVTYEFRFKSFEIAKEFFLEKKPILIAELGSPMADAGSERYQKWMNELGFEVLEDEKYVLFWVRPTRKIYFRLLVVGAQSAIVGLDIKAKK